MITFDEAVERYIKELPDGLKNLYRQNVHIDEHPFYCPQCGWYYPHDNWLAPTCPVCDNINIIQVDNSTPTFGLFAGL